MRFLVAVTFILIGVPAWADDLPKLEDFKWIARPLVIFADSEADPRVAQQLQMLEEDMARLEERDVVILVDTDPTVASPLRLALRPRDFMVVQIGKEAGVIYRKPKPVTAREIIHLIDRTPLRKQELEARKQ